MFFGCRFSVYSQFVSDDYYTEYNGFSWDKGLPGVWLLLYNMKNNINKKAFFFFFASFLSFRFVSSVKNKRTVQTNLMIKMTIFRVLVLYIFCFCLSVSLFCRLFAHLWSQNVKTLIAWIYGSLSYFIFYHLIFIILGNVKWKWDENTATKSYLHYADRIDRQLQRKKKPKWTTHNKEMKSTKMDRFLITSEREVQILHEIIIKTKILNKKKTYNEFINVCTSFYVNINPILAWWRKTRCLCLT